MSEFAKHYPDGTKRTWGFDKKVQGPVNAISRDEFTSWMENIRASLEAIEEKVDRQNGRTRKNETDIAIMKDREQQSNKRSGWWGGIIGAIVAGAVEIAAHALTK